MLEEIKIKQQKRDALARLNSKHKMIEEVSQKSAKELHQMKLVVPGGSRDNVNSSNSKGDLSTD